MGPTPATPSINLRSEARVRASAEGAKATHSSASPTTPHSVNSSALSLDSSFRGGTATNLALSFAPSTDVNGQLFEGLFFPRGRFFVLAHSKRGQEAAFRLKSDASEMLG